MHYHCSAGTPAIAHQRSLEKRRVPGAVLLDRLDSARWRSYVPATTLQAQEMQVLVRMEGLLQKRV
jgi:hypothetical protein